MYLHLNNLKINNLIFRALISVLLCSPWPLLELFSSAVSAFMKLSDKNSQKNHCLFRYTSSIATFVCCLAGWFSTFTADQAQFLKIFLWKLLAVAAAVIL